MNPLEMLKSAVAMAAVIATFWAFLVFWPWVKALFNPGGFLGPPLGSVDDETGPGAYETARVLVNELSTDGSCFGSFGAAGVIRGSRIAGGYRVWCGPRFKLCGSTREAFSFIHAYLEEKASADEVKPESPML